MSILENLWYGNVSPSERSIKKNSEYNRLSKASLEQEERFIKELSKDGRKAYEEHASSQMAMVSISECDSFVCGFRLGAKMILEILGVPDSQLPQINIY